MNNISLITKDLVKHEEILKIFSQKLQYLTNSLAVNFELLKNYFIAYQNFEFY